MEKVRTIIINPAAGGVSRTIKAQYWKNSLANFIHDDGLACTALFEVWRLSN